MQKRAVKSYEIDMCNGPIFSRLVLFTVPLMLSGILQLLFNAADIIVVGRFAGKESMAAVGSTTSLINLLVNFFVGLSVVTNVLTARYYGGQKGKELNETVHTAMVLALAGGVILLMIGEMFATPILRQMGSPDDVLPLASLYLKIYFIGTPGTLLYNFGSAILRAAGDTRRPLYYLTIAGVTNVVLNLIFVIGLSMGVAGVGTATIVSQYISAALVIRCLIQSDSVYRLRLRELRIVPDKLSGILRIGLPAGLQSSIFSISNVLIQSSINSFGSVAMAGSSAAANLEGFVYISMNSVAQTVLSFTSQNYGARNYERMRKILMYSLGLVTFIGIVAGDGVLLLGKQLLGIYSSDAEVVAYGLERLRFVSGPYFLCGLMDVMCSGIRGIGYSMLPTLVSLTGACALRIVWIYTIFAVNRTLAILYLSYPVTWTITFAAHAACYLMIQRSMVRRRARRAVA
ncbi:MAG: MATE family efflux transporter [Clostridiales bacterium]|nr:MATE family efflux transporter [Clostridiales bacterium]